MEKPSTSRTIDEKKAIYAKRVKDVRKVIEKLKRLSNNTGMIKATPLFEEVIKNINRLTIKDEKGLKKAEKIFLVNIEEIFLNSELRPSFLQKKLSTAPDRLSSISEVESEDSYFSVEEESTLLSKTSDDYCDHVDVSERGKAPAKSLPGSKSHIKSSKKKTGISDDIPLIDLTSAAAQLNTVIKEKGKSENEINEEWDVIFNIIIEQDKYNTEDTYNKLTEALNGIKNLRPGKCEGREEKNIRCIILGTVIVSIGIVFILLYTFNTKKNVNNKLGTTTLPEDGKPHNPNLTDNLNMSTIKKAYNVTKNIIHSTAEATYNNLTTLAMTDNSTNIPESLLNNTTTDNANFTQGASYSMSSP